MMICNRVVFFSLLLGQQYFNGYAEQISRNDLQERKRRSLQETVVISDKEKLNIVHFTEFNAPISPKEQILRHRHKHDENGSRTSDSSYSASEDADDDAYKREPASPPDPLRPGYALRGIDPSTESPEAVMAGGLKIPFLSITENMVDDPNLSTFLGAMTVVDLVTPLNNPGNYTLFAPTNEAFEKLPGGTMEKYMGNGWGMHLEDIVMSHLTNDHVEANNLMDGTEINTLNGDTMLITRDPDTNAKINGYISITGSDIKASNGIMEEIDGVILPPSALLDIATYAEIVSDIDVIPYSFKSLLNLLQLADLSDYISLTSPITLLAPHDSAIEKLEPAFVDYLADPLNEDMLVKVLQYHIIAGNKYSKSIVSGKDVETINGDSVRIFKNIKFGQYKSSKMIIDLKASIVDSDVLASNGVMHVIDALLVPDDVKDAYNLFKSKM